MLIRLFLFLSLVFIFGPYLPIEARATTANPLRIQRIDIEGHQRTAAHIIRRELLFSVGDLVDSTLFAESARNLRRLFFIGEVNIRYVEEGGSARVTVAVEDLYSRGLSPLISGQVDELSIGMVGLDYNLFGRGQSLRASVENRAISGYWADLFFEEPRLSGGRHALSGQLGIGAEGHAHAIDFSRPFTTLADRRAYGLSLSSQRTLQRLYTDGRLSQRYSDELKSGRLWFIGSFGQQTKIRPSLQVNISQRQFAAIRPFLDAPQNRNRFIPSIGLLIWRPQYNRARFIQDLGPLEDLQTGSWLSLRLGIAHKDLGSDRTFTFYQFQLSPRLQPARRTFTQLTFYATTRHAATGFYNLAALASLISYTRIGSMHSLALRLSWEGLHRSEDATQLLLGLERGLRGFDARRLDGSRRLRLNIEARPTIIRNPWYVIGGALFADFGKAWTPNEDKFALEFTPGFGVRLGLPKVYNTPVFRGDLAYGVGLGSWQLSVGLGQYF